MNRRLVLVTCLMLLSTLPVWATAQQTPPVRPYDGIQAGLDAYRLGEERRRSDFQQQVDENENLRAWSGLPGLYGEAMSYRDSLRPSSYYPPDEWYGYGYSSSGSLFGPWPYRLNDGWAESYPTPYRQPVGRWEGQTGANRWESHPVYDPPLTPYRVSPPVDSPWLDRTPYATPRPRFYEWSDGYPGRPDTDLPPPPPASPRSESPTFGDDFDLPRRAREVLPDLEAPKTLAPAEVTPRVREF